MTSSQLYRLAAFTDDPTGGNPAGVWIGESLPEPSEMQSIASRVGYSETAFIAPDKGFKRTIRYFSPEMEVSFCGHATIASSIALGRVNGEGLYELQTSVGQVPVEVSCRDGSFEAALQTVEPQQKALNEDVLEEALSALNWAREDLDADIPPIRAYAGAWHLLIAANSAERLADLNYDYERLKKLMLRAGFTTVQLVWKENDSIFHSRNPFPVGGVVEDPATGAAAGALAGYLRAAGMLKAPAQFTVRQGVTMGRPSTLFVEVPEVGGITIKGTAVEIDG